MFEGCIDLTTISASFSIPNFTNWTFNSGDGPNNFCYRMFKSSGIVIGGPSSVAFTMPSTMPTGTNAQNSWGFEIFPGIVSTACAAGQSIQIPRG
jgi:hypothetical protein